MISYPQIYLEMEREEWQTECNDEIDDFRDGRESGWADVGV